MLACPCEGDGFGVDGLKHVHMHSTTISFRRRRSRRTDAHRTIHLRSSNAEPSEGFEIDLQLKVDSFGRGGEAFRRSWIGVDGPTREVLTRRLCWINDGHGSGGGRSDTTLWRHGHHAGKQEGSTCIEWKQATSCEEDRCSSLASAVQVSLAGVRYQSREELHASMARATAKEWERIRLRHRCCEAEDHYQRTRGRGRHRRPRATTRSSETLASQSAASLQGVRPGTSHCRRRCLLEGDGGRRIGGHTTLARSNSGVRISDWRRFPLHYLRHCI
mmetsp:Transcript_4968/g.31790  ORF Transcript_4968/g.31790 Transcript_4968/m.31790 type:complete len:274 (-) Transcript_4968:1769-2590(-)